MVNTSESPGLQPHPIQTSIVQQERPKSKGTQRTFLNQILRILLILAIIADVGGLIFIAYIAIPVLFSAHLTDPQNPTGLVLVVEAVWLVVYGVPASFTTALIWAGYNKTKPNETIKHVKS